MADAARSVRCEQAACRAKALTTRARGRGSGSSVVEVLVPGSTYRSLWSLSLYPQAGEGGGCLSVRRMVLPSGGPPNVQRAAEEAARRARAKIRRYAAANRLNRLGTLTYSGEGCHDPLRLREDLAGFFRELRAGLAAGRFPYLWVPQWHPGGHGLHAHFAVGRFVPRRLIERCWGNGFVHIGSARSA